MAVSTTAEAGVTYFSNCTTQSEKALTPARFSGSINGSILKLNTARTDMNAHAVVGPTEVVD